MSTDLTDDELGTDERLATCNPIWSDEAREVLALVPRMISEIKRRRRAATREVTL